jgi:hypothetical protein
MADCPLWAIALKITEMALILGQFFPLLKNNALVYILGDFFHKLIWSPCQQPFLFERWLFAKHFGNW